MSSYDNMKYAWKMINRIFEQQKDIINDTANQILQKLASNNMQRYFDFRKDCNDLMSFMIELLYQHVFQTLDTSETDVLMQNFICNTLADRNNFENLMLSYAEKKANAPKLHFTTYYLGSHKHHGYAMNDGNEKPIIKYRKGEDSSLKSFIEEKSSSECANFPEKLTVEELQNKILPLVQKRKYMSNYTLRELISFIHGRDVFSLDDERYNDGEEIPMQSPAAPLSVLLRKIDDLVADKKYKFSESDRQRAFVSILCSYKGTDQACIIRQVSWMTPEDKRKLIQWFEQNCGPYGQTPTVSEVAEFLNLGVQAAAISKAMGKLRKLLNEYPTE